MISNNINTVLQLEPIRQRIAADVDAYIASGGKVTQFEIGQSSYAVEYEAVKYTEDGVIELRRKDGKSRFNHGSMFK